MRIEAMPALPDDRVEPAWQFYRETFDELRVHAVQRHLMHRTEFDEMMADKRFGKYLAVDAGGDIVGLSVMTSNLSALPLLSQDYFIHRWPEMYAEQRIFYIVFAGAVPGARGAGVFVRLLREMMGPLSAVDGMGMVDVCSHNELVRNLPEAIGRILGRVDGRMRSRRLDSQSYWLYEFPAVS
jgi:hypothetical protein